MATKEEQAEFEAAVKWHKGTDKERLDWARKLGKAYYLTEQWRTIRDFKIAKVENKCEKCGHNSRLQVHHLRYIRLGCENVSDLVVYCRHCHMEAHNITATKKEKPKKKEKKKKYEKKKAVPLPEEQYATTQSDKQTVCIVCRKAIDYDEECAVGIQGTKVFGRVLCLACHANPQRKEEEKRLHFARVQKLAEKSPKQKRKRDRLIQKNKQYVPSSLRGSYALRQDYLNALKRDK
jgi:hypothetical protein